jgi:hypothetical protein
LWQRQPEYIDVRKDRMVFFGDLDGREKYFELRLQAARKPCVGRMSFWIFAFRQFASRARDTLNEAF